MPLVDKNTLYRKYKVQGIHPHSPKSIILGQPLGHKVKTTNIWTRALWKIQEKRGTIKSPTPEQYPSPQKMLPVPLRSL